MKSKIFSIFFLMLNFCSYAKQPNVILSNSSSNEAISILLKIDNANEIKDISYQGLESIAIIGREINFNSSSSNNESNVFYSKLFLLPEKPETIHVFAKVKINGKDYNSNKLDLVISQREIASIKTMQKKRAEDAKKQMEKAQKEINAQMKKQQEFFNDVYKIMIKNQQEIIKSLNTK